jgi:alkaline phosphatase D
MVVTMSGINKRGTERRGNVRFWFKNWTVSGNRVRVQQDRAWGPILFAMHTLSRGVMKLTAQMAPVGKSPELVRLQTQRGSAWRTIATSPIDPLSRTATFRVPKWPAGADTPYRVAYKMGRDYYFEGAIPKDPIDKPKIVVAGLSCNNDFGFPHTDVARGVRHFRPDVALFVGDQIYERCAGYGIQRLPLETAALDYLRKWYLFGWEFRDILRDTPSVCLPDDHDVYHGNVWGAGGRHAEGVGQAGQDSGGYIEPAAWVNMMQRTQTSHLPDPFDPTPVEQGIGVYYTELRLGGVSFALLEDRKWKSPPKQLLPDAKIVNGWAQNPAFNPVREGDVPGAQLLGDRQQRFLDHWAADWSGGAWMKAVVSQTLFANVATLPPPANDDSVTGKLPILKPGEYAEAEVHTADHDSNGWPQSQRNRALRAFRRCFAVHITGDQHLGSTIQYGIDDWNDAAFAICTPAVSNIFPRRWYPPQPGRNPLPHSPRNTGEFLDGFGNKITVHTVFNPQQIDAAPNPLMDRSPGYGIIEFDRATHKITLAVWPRREGTKPAAGWPITIDQVDNGFPHKGFVLDTIETPRRGLCAQVIREDGEIVYTLRLSGSSFTPRVYDAGVYSVRIFDPDGKYQQTRKGMKALPA